MSGSDYFGIDRVAEPWPFEDEPPPLTQVPRKTVDAITAPQSDLKRPGYTEPSEIPELVPKVPQIEPETPPLPELTLVKKNGEIVLPKLEIKSKPGPPALEVTRPHDYVYLLIGQNRQTEETHLARIITDKEYQALVKLGKEAIDASRHSSDGVSKGLRGQLMALILEDLETLKKERRSDSLGNVLPQTLNPLDLSPGQQRRGIIFYADICGVDPSNPFEASDQGEDNHPDPIDDEAYLAYSWVLIKYKIAGGPRLNLTGLF